jgi:hypothetical protein
VAKQDQTDGKEYLERAGVALDRIGGAGFPELHDTLARGVRQRWSIIGRDRHPLVRSRDFIDMVNELETLADVVEAHEEAYYAEAERDRRAQLAETV